MAKGFRSGTLIPGAPPGSTLGGSSWPREGGSPPMVVYVVLAEDELTHTKINKQKEWVILSSLYLCSFEVSPYSICMVWNFWGPPVCLWMLDPAFRSLTSILPPWMQPQSLACMKDPDLPHSLQNIQLISISVISILFQFNSISIKVIGKIQVSKISEQIYQTLIRHDTILQLGQVLLWFGKHASSFLFQNRASHLCFCPTCLTPTLVPLPSMTLHSFPTRHPIFVLTSVV